MKYMWIFIASINVTPFYVIVTNIPLLFNISKWTDCQKLFYGATCPIKVSRKHFSQILTGCEPKLKCWKCNIAFEHCLKFSCNNWFSKWPDCGVLLWPMRGGQNVGLKAWCSWSHQLFSSPQCNCPWAVRCVIWLCWF